MKTNIDLFGSGLDPALDVVAMSQLGAAAVLLWPRLSVEDQNELIRVISLISGIPTVASAAHRVLDLVERNKPTKL